MTSNRSISASIIGLLLTTVVLACADSAAPTTSPLEGLPQLSTSDTGTKKPIDPPVGVGTFHGVVRGYQTGVIDTLGTAVLLANVTVTAYHRIATDSDPFGVGAQAGAVVTDAQGVFQLPSLPAGDYVVTFTPQGSTYQAGWTVATASATSNVSPWWIMLAKK